MGVQKVFLIVLLLLTLLSSAYGAKVVGAIYDHDLSPIKKAVLTINTTPEQTKVSPYGGYHFIVEPGSYQITATYSKNGITKEIASEYITISDDGEYARDLFIYPGFIIQEEFDDTLANKIGNFVDTHEVMIGIAIGSLLIIILLAVLGTKYIRLLFKKEITVIEQENKRLKKQLKEEDNSTVSENEQLPNDLSTQEKSNMLIEKKILTILKKKKNHICTQKEIRKEFRLSEAKISLTLSNMEENGQIAKIKQGRRNVIKLVK